MFWNNWRLVFCSWVLITIVFSPNSSAPARARAIRIHDFPFWRDRLQPNVLAAHCPLGRTPQPAWSTSICQGSSSVPKEALRSTTSWASLRRATGATRSFGAAASRELIDDIGLLLLRPDRGDLAENHPVLAGQRRYVPCRRPVGEGLRQPVAGGGQPVQLARVSFGHFDLLCEPFGLILLRVESAMPRDAPR